MVVCLHPSCIAQQSSAFNCCMLYAAVNDSCALMTRDSMPLTAAEKCALYVTLLHHHTQQRQSQQELQVLSVIAVLAWLLRE